MSRDNSIRAWVNSLHKEIDKVETQEIRLVQKICRCEANGDPIGAVEFRAELLDVKLQLDTLRCELMKAMDRLRELEGK